MAQTNENRFACDSVPHYCDRMYLNSHFSFGHPPSSSNSAPDLSGFDYNMGSSHASYNSYNESHPGRDLNTGSIILPVNFPPSPPPTNSDPKRSVPLPCLNSNASSGSSFPHSHEHSFLEGSCSALKHVVAPSLQVPLTPPPTLPTPTLALPPTCEDFFSIHKVDALDSSFLCLPSPSTSPDQHRPARHLLSPISPEWTTSHVSYESPPVFAGGDGILLHGNTPTPPDSLHYQTVLDNADSPAQCRPVLPPLDIPVFSLSPEDSWDSSGPSTMDVDYDSELDSLSTPLSPLSHLAEKLDLEPVPLMFGNDFPDEKFESYPHPSPPPVHSFEFMPEIDDVLASPSSPSLRLYSSLPTLSPDEEDDLGLMSPPSPSQPFLSLPGADTDDDLIPTELALSPYPPDDFALLSPYSPSGNLLLLDDTNDVPFPRSPSPEPFDLDPALLEGCTDPEIQRLNELRRRSQNAERSARQLENAMLEQGVAQQRWEARRKRKQEKERGREIGAMLRLKMAEKGKEGEKQSLESGGDGIDGRLGLKRKSGIRTMDHLVAKMLLRRNDSHRSLVNRKTPSTPKFQTSSPLARSLALPSDEDDEQSTGNTLQTKPGGNFLQGTRPLTPWTMTPLPAHSNI